MLTNQLNRDTSQPYDFAAMPPAGTTQPTAPTTTTSGGGGTTVVTSDGGSSSGSTNYTAAQIMTASSSGSMVSPTGAGMASNADSGAGTPAVTSGSFITNAETSLASLFTLARAHWIAIAAILAVVWFLKHHHHKRGR